MAMGTNYRKKSMNKYFYIALFIFCPIQYAIGQNNCINNLCKFFYYDSWEQFNCGVAPVLYRGRWGLIDTCGNEVFPCVLDYEFVKPIGEQLFVWKRTGAMTWGFIDIHGNEICLDSLSMNSITRNYENIRFQNKLLPVFNEITKKWGFIDNSGEMILSFKEKARLYDHNVLTLESGFAYGKARIYDNGFYFIDTQGNKNGPYDSWPTQYRYGYSIVRKNNIVSLIDTNYQEITLTDSNIVEQNGRFVSADNGYSWAYVYDNGKIDKYKWYSSQDDNKSEMFIRKWYGTQIHDLTGILTQKKRIIHIKPLTIAGVYGNLIILSKYVHGNPQLYVRHHKFHFGVYSKYSYRKEKRLKRMRLIPNHFDKINYCVDFQYVELIKSTCLDDCIEQIYLYDFQGKRITTKPLSKIIPISKDLMLAKDDDYKTCIVNRKNGRLLYKADIPQTYKIPSIMELQINDTTTALHENDLKGIVRICDLNPYLKYLEIPETVSLIEIKTYNYRLKKVVVFWEDPKLVEAPICWGDKSIILEVPKGTKEKYIIMKPWSNFTIVERKE